ncbi:MAG: alpha/beta hydrolase, partial [Phycicoccus sp.]
VRDEDRYTGPWKTKTATPVLLLNNTLDGATPVENAEAVNDLLRGSVLLRVDAVGHLSTNGGTAPSQCAADAVNRYLLDGVLPAAGTVCRSEQPEPFPAPATTGAPQQTLDAAGQLVARR